MENAFTNVCIILCWDHFYILYTVIYLIGNNTAPYCTSRVRGWGRGGKVAINLDHHNLPAPPTEMTIMKIFFIEGINKLHFQFSRSKASISYTFANAFAPYTVCVQYPTVNISCTFWHAHLYQSLCSARDWEW